MSSSSDLLSRFTVAPTWDEWRALTPQEQQVVYDALPTEEPGAAPPEGTRHFEAKVTALDTLRRFYRRSGRRAFVASELPVHYPGERVFVPDLLVVFDVEDHDRTKWLVTREGKGLDFVLEVHDGGERRKDLERRRDQLARLHVPEYFVYDRSRGALHGFELPTPDASAYRPIVPQLGKYASEVLGLELQVVEQRLRFTYFDAQLPESTELIQRMEQALSDLEEKREEEQRRREEEQRLREEEQRRREEEQRLREEVERENEALRAQLAALRARKDGGE